MVSRREKLMNSKVTALNITSLQKPNSHECLDVIKGMQRMGVRKGR